MQISFGVILVSGICGGLLPLNALPVTLHRQKVSSRQIEHKAHQEMFNLVDLPNNHHRSMKNNVLKEVSKFQGIFMGHPPPKESGYVMVKSMRQRDKRYISYLTFCHFKICNMGRKRTTRYFHVIRRLDEDENNK